MPPKRKKTAMTDEHKQALAEGRAQARAVGAYLEALEAHRPKRGRKRTAESVQKRLAQVTDQLADTGGTARLDLIQERRDLEVELATMQAGTPDLSALEKEFVAVARAYAARKGISYAALREFGVSADVLKQAGVTRGG